HDLCRRRRCRCRALSERHASLDELLRELVHRRDDPCQQGDAVARPVSSRWHADQRSEGELHETQAVMRIVVVVLLAVGVTSGPGVARAARGGDAGQAFGDALRREAAGDASVIDTFEALGTASPPTIWSDDAFVEAARLAERAGDLARARRDYERAIAI